MTWYYGLWQKCWRRTGRPGRRAFFIFPRCCITGDVTRHPRQPIPTAKIRYEAGLRALRDHAALRGIPATACETRHVGFYRLQYTDVLQNRPDVAAVGGRVLSGKTGKIIGGRMTVEGKVFYEGLRQGFGGYLHRAELSQDAQALDLRCIRIQPSCREVFEKIVGVPYTEIRRHPGEQPVFDVTVLPAGVDIRTLSLRLSKALRQQGRLLYLPEYPGECKTL